MKRGLTGRYQIFRTGDEEVRACLATPNEGTEPL
jgi:hypothetical protein